MRLEELNIYNNADAISDKIWEMVEEWDYYRKDTIGKQLVRAADSISANIAEGYGRFFFKENRNFCYYSRGSLLETKTWLGKAHRRKLIGSQLYHALIEELESLHKSLNGYIKYITDQSKNQKD